MKYKSYFSALLYYMPSLHNIVNQPG